MRLSNISIEAVRERASIVDQFNQAKLKRAGREFVTQCPWHDDKRPSLTVSPATNRAYCFVCARGVDSIGWIQDQEGMSFSDSVIRLAERYGIQVEADSAEDQAKWRAEQAERQAIFSQREKQRTQFVEMLAGSPGEEYLHDRGLTDETIAEWRIGWNGSRVMFPLDDPQGRVVAFTGRVLDDSKPKYKNSQNDALYQKAEMVFGLSRARSEITKTTRIVICEGQMDVISCWQEGVRNMVAVSGSSLTQEMIDRIIKQTHAKEITLCFDGDLGGLKAADRALRSLQNLALTGDITLKILTLPEGCDPADLADAMPELIADAPHWVEWWFDREVGQIDLNDPRQIVAAEAGVKRILRVLPTGALREFVRRRAKEVLKAVPDIQPAKVQTQKQINRCHWAERRALRLYLHDTGSRPALSDLDYTDPLMIQAWGLILAIEGTLPPESGLLASSFSVVIQGAPEAVMDACRSLVRPIPEVLRVITANPLNELQGAMDVLLSEACQASNSDHGRMGLTVARDEVDSLQRS